MNNAEDTLDYSNVTQFIASHPVPLESVIATSAPAPAPAKKVQLMKRSVGKQSSDGAKVLVTKQQQSEEDREKAYNQARARIFGDGDVPSNLDGCSVNPSNSTEKLSSSQSQKDLSSSAPSSSTSSNASSVKQTSTTSTAGLKNNTSGKSASSQIQKSPSDNNFETSKSVSSGGAVRKVISTSSLSIESNSINTPQPTQTAASKGSKNSRAEASTPPSTGSTDKDKSSNSNNDSPVDIAATSNTSGKNAKVFQASNNNNNTSNNADRAHTSIRKKAVDVGSWKGNKSQVRDLDAERSDPDFVRRSSPSLLISTSTQQQQQIQQGRQSSMNVNTHMMSGIHMPHAGDGIIYMQNAQSSGQYMNMMQSSANPAAGAPSAMYTNMAPQLDSSQMIYSNPHHSAVPMAHPYSGAIINSRTVSEGTYMVGDMSNNASSNGGGQPVAMHEYPQNIPAPGPLPNNAYYSQNGPIMLAPSLQQPMSIISAGPSAGQAGPPGVYYQQTVPGGGLPWPPQQHQHMNMVQVVSSGPYYPPHQNNHNQPYISSSSSADQQQQQQQQQFIQSQQAEMYPYNSGNGNPPNGNPYYDYPAGGYYAQPQTQLQEQQYDAANQASPTKAKKGQQRIFYSSEFPPLG